ncbi:hypothetical protein ACUN9W_15240, partial [Escherichia coli]
MTHLELVPVPPVAQLAGVSQHYEHRAPVAASVAWSATAT